MKAFIIFIAFTLTTFGSERFSYTETDLKLYSKINLTWWGFKVYKAEVFTPKSSKPDFTKEILLHIEYQRDFDAEDLVSTTYDEWERLGLIVDGKSKKWLKQLEEIWPDVKKGDSLTTYLNGDTTSFYQDKKLLGQVKDETFGSRFLKIWLHEKSRTSDLLKKTSK